MLFLENDVLILSHAMIKFQRLFRQLSDDPSKELDIFPCCLTIASACIQYYQMNFIGDGDERIAIIPEEGSPFHFLHGGEQFSLKIKAIKNRIDNR